MSTPGLEPLPVPALRWRCDPDIFSFTTTRDVRPLAGVVGQDAAVESLQFGLECNAHGQNVFVRGLTGTGRMTLIRRLLEDIRPACAPAPDRVYVHNFDDPLRPSLITLPRGQAVAFEKAVDRLIEFIAEDLPRALSSDTFKSRMQGLERGTEGRVQEISDPLRNTLAEAGLALVMVSAGQSARPAIFPTIDGKPAPPEAFEAAYVKGEVPDEQYDAVRAGIDTHRDAVEALATQILAIMEEHFKASHKLLEEEVRVLLAPARRRIVEEFSGAAVERFLENIIEDVAENRLQELAESTTFTERYRVNVLLAHEPSDGCPTIVENAPTESNLIGGMERNFIGDKERPPDHVAVRAGSLLRADGGYLVLEARDVLSESSSWKALIRTLRTGKLEITPAVLPWTSAAVLLQPEPIEVNVKVILIGDPGLYHVLNAVDPDFNHLFKVLVEFDTVIPRDEESLLHYAGVVERIAQEDELPPFDRSAVAALAEHGVRIASSRGKLTSRFSRLADIAREAGFLTTKDGRDVVVETDVRNTIARTKRRANLTSRKFREMVAEGTIRIATDGRVVGQVNGLAVIHAGPLTYGFPARITSSIGPGTAGVINIERESELSGAIHTKGMYILGGLLRNLLRTEHPLTFEGSIAFEQSYGGIDGDSASGAEICCLLSAITGIPARQDLAMTGAIDQIGAVQAIGGVNEKIEGFFDACVDAGLTGTQGVIIPASNAADLQLRIDVVEACERGEFSVYAVDSICQAIELLLDTPCGQPGDDSADTVIGAARAQTRQFWEMAVHRDRGSA